MCDLKFSVISDSHISHMGDEKEKFERTVKYHADNFPDSDLYIFNGDIVYQVDSAEEPQCKNLYPICYDTANDIINKYIPEKKKIFVIGNHEFPQGNTEEKITKKAFEMWREKFGAPFHEHIIIKGYHFIKMGAYSWNFTVGEAEEEWAVSEIEKAKSDGEKPIFVLHHGSIPNTVAFSENSRLFSESFTKYIKRQPRVIFIGGHEHNHFLDEKSIYQDGFTMISAPMCAGVSCFSGCDFLKPRVEDVSQSLFFEVENNKVTVIKADNAANKIWHEPWIIDIEENKKGIFRYGEERKWRYPCNSFSRNAEIRAYLKDDELVISVEQRFKNNGIVEYYDITVSDEERKNVYHTVRHTDFYRLSMDIPQDRYYEMSIPEPESGRYDIEVRALNCFFKTGGEVLCTTIDI